MRTVSLIVFAALFSCTSAWATDKCELNGKPYDDRYGFPEHFTGEFFCKDVETGKPHTRDQYVDGKKEGQFVHYDSEGRLDEEGTKVDEKLHGVFKRYQNGKLTMEMAYDHGKQVGVMKWYEDDHLHRVANLIPNGDSDNSLTDTEFQLNAKGQLTQLSCGKGPISKKDAEWCGRDGKQSTVSIYTEDGKLSRTEQFRWGKEHGTFTSYNVRTGKPYKVENYIDGKRSQDGQRHFDKEGRVTHKSDCDETRKKCTETLYFDDAKAVQETIVWTAGKKSRDTTFYQNGKTKRDIEADGARFKITDYYDTGKVDTKGTYVEASDWYWMSYIPDGVIENFTSDGGLYSRETYKSGRLEGQTDRYWTVKGHHIHSQTQYEKNHMVSRKMFADDKLVQESEYFPDGSIKKDRKVSPAPANVGI